VGPKDPISCLHPQKKLKDLTSTDYVRSQVSGRGDVRSHKKGENTLKNSLLQQYIVENTKKFCRDSVPTPVARGGCGAEAPPLAARPYVAGSPDSPLTHLLDGHRKLVGCSTIPARSCSGPVRYHWGSIIELEVPPDETLGLMTLHPYNTNVLQSITYAKSPYPPDRSNPGQKTNAFDTSMASPPRQHNFAAMSFPLFSEQEQGSACSLSGVLWEEGTGREHSWAWSPRKTAEG